MGRGVTLIGIAMGITFPQKLHKQRKRVISRSRSHLEVAKSTHNVLMLISVYFGHK